MTAPPTAKAAPQPRLPLVPAGFDWPAYAMLALGFALLSWVRWLSPESRPLRGRITTLLNQAFSRAVAIVAYQRGTPGIAFAWVACAKARLLFECGCGAEGLRPSRNSQVAQGRVGRGRRPPL